MASQVYGLGTDVTGKDPLGWFVLNFIENKNLPCIGDSENHVSSINDPKRIEIIEVKRYKTTLEIEAGYEEETNAWVEWVKFTVQAHHKSDCYSS